MSKSGLTIIQELAVTFLLEHAIKRGWICRSNWWYPTDSGILKKTVIDALAAKGLVEIEDTGKAPRHSQAGGVHRANLYTRTSRFQVRISPKRYSELKATYPQCGKV